MKELELSRPNPKQKLFLKAASVSSVTAVRAAAEKAGL